MSPNPALPSFFRDIENLLRALSEAIFVWPIFLSHHLWHSFIFASPSGPLTTVGPSSHLVQEKEAPGNLGRDRQTIRRSSRASRARKESAAKVRRDLTPTARHRTSTTQNDDRDATPTPTTSRSGAEDLRLRLATSNFTDVTITRSHSQPVQSAHSRVKAKHVRHFSTSTDGTISSSEPGSVRRNSSAASSRSSSISSTSSYPSILDELTSARKTHFRPPSHLGLSNSEPTSDNENGGSSGGESTIRDVSSSGHSDGLKLGEISEVKKRGGEERKDWEQKRLVDAIERLQLSLVIDEKEKDDSAEPITRQPSPLLVNTGVNPSLVKPSPPTINVHSPPKSTLTIYSVPSITIIPPPPPTYDSDMDDDEDTAPTPTAENASPPYRLANDHHPRSSPDSAPTFINPFSPPESAFSSTVTLTRDTSSPQPPSPKSSPTRRTLKLFSGRDDKKSASHRGLPTLPSMKKLFGHRGGKVRPHIERTSEDTA